MRNKKQHLVLFAEPSADGCQWHCMLPVDTLHEWTIHGERLAVGENLGLDPWERAPYIVTHIGTGRYVAKVFSLKDARPAAKRRIETKGVDKFRWCIQTTPTVEQYLAEEMARVD